MHSIANKTKLKKQDTGLKKKLLVVVPVRGKSDVLEESLASICTSVEHLYGTVLVLVDNNDLDVYDEVLYSFSGRCNLIRSTKPTVGGVRNSGVAYVQESFEYVAFVDSDCVVKSTFCSDVIQAFEVSGAAAVGCKVIAPPNGHWTEVASDALHRKGGDGFREHLNSGCLAIRADVFKFVEGFSEVLPSNEDYDICNRIRGIGGQIWQSESLQVVHLGNPKSVPAFMQRLRWHGRGAFNADGTLELTPMLAMTLVNCTILTSGFLASFYLANKRQWASAILTLGIAAVLTPLLFWAIRIFQMKRWINPVPAILLMQLTFVARLQGLILQRIHLANARSTKKHRQ